MTSDDDSLDYDLAMEDNAKLRAELERVKAENARLIEYYLDPVAFEDRCREEGAKSMVQCINANRIDKDDPEESLPHLGEEYWMTEWRGRQKRGEG